MENDELIEVVLDDNSNYSIASYEQDDKEFERVRNEVVNSVMKKLRSIFGGVGKPGI